MQRNVKSLIGFTMGATDGEFGKVEEFYFDDETWTVRYLIVKTGGWLSERKVLISPWAVEKPDWDHKVFPVNLTQEQIKNSPDIDTQKPVSRQQEIELYTYYAWPHLDDVGIGFYGGIGMMGMSDSRIPFEDVIADKFANDRPADPHLRSTHEVKGYFIHATDGNIGEVEDFIIDDRTWNLRYLVVDTGNWFSGKKVLISPKWIKSLEWKNSAVHVDISIDAVKNSPEYDPSQPINELYENNLHEHYYGKPKDE
ncbi:PRC-barrel domain-containing protein [Pedobacter sp. L105]|uniref:PRC-barrel domain-containing protein n=1 Tax=Pedobacter sp. L105 TaxID=1641871 RepID=UPI00131E86E6|nr:PRC-barrel domain-containing protein [Pedobacter sp. L105]